MFNFKLKHFPIDNFKMLQSKKIYALKERYLLSMIKKQQMS